MLRTPLLCRGPTQPLAGEAWAQGTAVANTDFLPPTLTPTPSACGRWKAKNSRLRAADRDFDFKNVEAQEVPQSFHFLSSYSSCRHRFSFDGSSKGCMLQDLLALIRTTLALFEPRNTRLLRRLLIRCLLQSVSSSPFLQGEFVQSTDHPIGRTESVN